MEERKRGVEKARERVEEAHVDVWKAEREVEEWKEKLEQVMSAKLRVDEVMGQRGKMADMRAEINRMQVRLMAKYTPNLFSYAERVADPLKFKNVVNV